MIEIPDSFAIGDQTTCMSGSEFRDEVDRIARSLRSLGLSSRERVVVLGHKSIQLAAAILAVPQAGGIAVAPYATLTQAQLRHIVADASPRFVITVTAAPSSTAKRLGRSQGIIAYGTLREDSRAETRRSLPAADEPALLIYTSGSTGKPKGVVFSNRNIRLGAESVAHYYGLTSADRVLCLLPFSFDAGLNQLFSAIVAGCRVQLQEFVLAQHTAALCAKHGITTLTGVPALWQKLARVEWPAPARDAMRRWCNTGGRMPGSLADRLHQIFPNAAPILMYGFTEAFRATYLPPHAYDSNPDSVGVPIPHAAIAVVRDDGELCEPGETGEIVQLGPLVTQGYWNQPDATRVKFAPLGDVTRKALMGRGNRHYEVPSAYLDQVAWSGDNGLIDDAGHLHFRERRTGLIKSQGFRVSPTEIEDACFASGLVQEAVALGVELAEDELIVATVVPELNDTERQRFERHLRASLPSYQVPSAIMYRERLPMTANGKYDLNVIREEITDELA